MKNVLLLNGAKEFGNSKGGLNLILHNKAFSVLKELGYEINQTYIDQGYDPKEEIDKIIKADVLLYQMPVWWMGEPWIVKKYMDEVFGLGVGVLFANDGRTQDNLRKNYGKGGLNHGKRYMFSLTLNAPFEAFSDKNEFFEGKGVDALYWHLHKAHEFIGMKPLATFMCNDVVKNPQVDKYLNDYDLHLRNIFSKNGI
ncbi:flavodoxin family protein [Campylobacter hepaticus]|uniref:Flavodoxin family protein n=1 Tax=Campylobacter hepaticus TaxID=1813019 RepID=A0A424Z0M8_9BACT|nr:NAD(P)H-dependent oxidoreductase [Campylobacter hepaticus]MDX2331530.1 NAD(P)H-dependent oxidoreductase [Campylobacter hepaticus]MDX2372145.1 NAD(P)H-dependent oxidoreductase [Campylobacter hepaticus]MDX2397511.1 NAD(P)H-dependent oxidoreductase [Campylobacter hepaticus]MDX5509302.1 NAD(P)H-dependent oxidoreductase [Campylobacter hepaticus]RQD67730.1 flavodoxin family protein [Campylobacter hepaticus]